MDETYRPVDSSTAAATGLLAPALLAFLHPLMIPVAAVAWIMAMVGCLRTRSGERVGRRLAVSAAALSSALLVTSAGRHVSLQSLENPEGCPRVPLSRLVTDGKGIAEEIRRREGERVLVKGYLYDLPRDGRPLRICVDRSFPIEVRSAADFDVERNGVDVAVTATLAIERDALGVERVILKDASLRRSTSILDPTPPSPQGC